MVAQELETLSVVASIVGILSFAFGLYFGFSQAKHARREAREARESRQLLDVMNSTLRIIAAKNLEPVEPVLRKGIIFSIWTAVAKLGIDATVPRIMRLLETEEPETISAWKVQVPSESARSALVDAVLKDLRDLEQRRTDEADGIPIGLGNKILYNKVGRIVNLVPFTRHARLSRHPWAGRLRIVFIGTVLVLGFSTLVTIAAAGGFVYLDFLLLSLWPFTVPLGIAALGLFELELSKRAYAEECQGRYEYSVVFGPGNFRATPTGVLFGRYCPAVVFSAPTVVDLP